MHYNKSPVLIRVARAMSALPLIGQSLPIATL